MSDQEYTLEELNYFRVCYIATKIIRDGLQSVFKQEWGKIHGVRLGLWQDTAKNGQDFFNMESWRSRRRSNRLLRIIQSGNTSEWDSTCFFFAILYSDSLGRLVSPTVATNVDDLRQFRNKVFAHRSRASMTDIDFHTDVNLVSNAFTALHLDTKELHKIINQSSFPTTELQQLQEKISVLEEELQAEPKSFKCLPPKPSHTVTERKAEVDKIMQIFKDLQQNDDDDSVVTVYVHGNPGCGKSQIARSVGNKFYDEALADGVHDSCTFVMTLNAESEQTMIDSYFKFARNLGVTEYSLNSIAGSDSKSKPDERISLLKTLVSAKVKDYATWLVIFDNANDLGSVKGCWPDEDWGGCGKVLVTTQDSNNLPFADFYCGADISLSRGMQMTDALALLRNICQFSCASDDEELEQSVVEALDFQPLAIACAALYVRFVRDPKVGRHPQAETSTWEDYLKKLDMGKRQITEQIYERTSKSYPLSMTSAVAIAVERLVQNDLFKHVVHFVGLGAPTPIDLNIMVSLVTKREPTLDADMVAADIAKCSLLICLDQDDNTSTFVKVHEVVHDVFKTHLANCSRGEIAAISKMFIETLVPLAQHNLHEFDLEFHTFSKMIAPHLRLFSDHLESPSFWTSPDIATDERIKVIKAFVDFGNICNNHGYLLAALTYFENALEISKEDDDENDNMGTFTATILNNLGTVYCKQGQFEKAKDHHKRALSLIEGLNPGHSTPEVADSLNKVGNVFYSLGRFQEAKENYRSSLEKREEFYGEDHATFAASLNNLGCVYSALGEHQVALVCYQRSLALEEKIHGKSHPHIADLLCNLGIECSELGSTAKAVEYHEQALEMREQLYLPDHLLISESHNNLGLMHKGLGQLERAMQCYESALRIRKKVLHHEHPAIAELLNNQGQVYMEMGELEKAKDLLHKARFMMEESLGRDHCKVGDTMLNLGLVHEQYFEFDRAIRHFRFALEIYSKSYPANHQLCQSAKDCLQRVTQQQADLGGPGNLHARAPLVTTGFRAAVQRSKILCAFTGSVWDRRIFCSAVQLDLDQIIIGLLRALVFLYASYFQGEGENGLFKTLWLAMPGFFIIDTSQSTIDIIVGDHGGLLRYRRNFHWRVLWLFLLFMGHFLEVESYL